MVPVVISVNDTFESVILESFKIKSVGVDAQALGTCILHTTICVLMPAVFGTYFVQNAGVLDVG